MDGEEKAEIESSRLVDYCEPKRIDLKQPCSVLFERSSSDDPCVMDRDESCRSSEVPAHDWER